MKHNPPEFGNTSIHAERMRLWETLLKASDLIEEEIRRRLRQECNWTLPRLEVMGALARAPEGLKMKHISKALRVSNGNITGIVDRLTSEALATREAVPGDRRAYTIRLTDLGRARFTELSEKQQQWTDEILSSLNLDDLEGMNRRLDHLIDALEPDGSHVKSP